jgi:hypothetical protein
VGEHAHERMVLRASAGVHAVSRNASHWISARVPIRVGSVTQGAVTATFVGKTAVMNRPKSLVLGLLAVLIHFAAPAHAQSQKAVPAALLEVIPVSMRVGETLTNLTQMRNGTVGAQEDRALQGVYELGLRADAAVLEVTQVGAIYALLTCESDIKAAHPIFARSANTTVKKLGLVVEGINGELPHLTSPANVAEVTKLRDLLLEEQRALQPLTAIEPPK